MQIFTVKIIYCEHRYSTGCRLNFTRDIIVVSSRTELQCFDAIDPECYGTCLSKAIS